MLANSSEMSNPRQFVYKQTTEEETDCFAGESAGDTLLPYGGAKSPESTVTYLLFPPSKVLNNKAIIMNLTECTGRWRGWLAVLGGVLVHITLGTLYTYGEILISYFNKLKL